MPSVKKQLITAPPGAEEINTKINVPQVEHDYEGDEAAQKYGDFGPQYHVNAVCCDYRNYVWTTGATCTDGWQCSHQTCLNCGNELTVWYPPWEKHHYE